MHAAQYSLAPYEALAAALRAELEIAAGNPGIGVSLLHSALARLQAERFHLGSTSFCRALAEGLALTGDTEEAMATIERP